MVWLGEFIQKGMVFCCSFHINVILTEFEFWCPVQEYEEYHRKQNEDIFSVFHACTAGVTGLLTWTGLLLFSSVSFQELQSQHYVE